MNFRIGSASSRSRRMRWASMTALAGMLALGLAACGSTGSGATTGANCPDTSNLHLVSSGKMTIASDTTYAPAEFEDPNKPGSYIGYDLDLAKELAARMCLTPVIQKADFSAIIPDISGPALGSQKYDASFSSFTINNDRLAKVNMIPYFQAGESILVPKGNPKNIKSIKDMCGLVVAVQDGTVEKDELDDANGKGPGTSGQTPDCKDKNIRIYHNADQNLVNQQVVNGSADAAYADEPIVGYAVSQNAGKVENAGRNVAPAPQGIVVRKDNADLENAMKTALKAMITDGKYLEILKHWGVETGSYTTGV
jgi:polar amino acid transport system substrate-binding protein